MAQPIEQEVNGVENMLYMSSKSPATGSMDLTITFAVGTDPDMAQVLAQNRVSIADPKLPAEVKQQGVVTKKQSTALVMVAALTSPDGRFDELYLSNYATTQVKDVLARVNGVGEVLMFGAKDYGMRIWLDPELLKARNLTTNEVLAALQEQNVQVAAGKIGEKPNPAGLNFEYTITTPRQTRRSEPVRADHRQTGRSGTAGPYEGHRSNRIGRAILCLVLRARRCAGHLHGYLPTARLECPGCRPGNHRCSRRVVGALP